VYLYLVPYLHIKVLFVMVSEVLGIRYICLKDLPCLQLIEKEDGKGATAGEIKLPEDLAYEESKVQGMLSCTPCISV
jgi:hypothetical protein